MQALMLQSMTAVQLQHCSIAAVQLLAHSSSSSSKIAVGCCRSRLRRIPLLFMMQVTMQLGARLMFMVRIATRSRCWKVKRAVKMFLVQETC
jgi:hypothetical protein